MFTERGGDDAIAGGGGGGSDVDELPEDTGWVESSDCRRCRSSSTL